MLQHIKNIMDKADHEKQRIWGYISPHFLERGVPHARLRSRDLFKYALILCEQHAASKNPDLTRLSVVIDLATKMQFPGAQFKWFWKDRQLRDLNAVEFCMRDATILYEEHQGVIQKLSDDTWNKLKRMLRSALKACKRHKVPEKYTNIVLLNALNLLNLGKLFNDQEAQFMGQERFNKFYRYTWEWGIHENNSPIYTPIQIDTLDLIETLWGKDETLNIKAILGFQEFLLQPIPTLEPLKGGTNQFQTYFSLLGLRFLTQIDLTDLYSKVSNLYTDAVVNNTNLPRIAKIHYGSKLHEFITECVYPDIILGTIAYQYDFPPGQDILFSVTFTNFLLPNNSKPNSNNPLPLEYLSSCYLIPGAKENAYYSRAKREIPLVWTTTQYNTDALGVAIYKPGYHDKLETTFVMPLNEDFDFYKGNQSDTQWDMAKIDVISNGLPTQNFLTQFQSGSSGDTLVLRNKDTWFGIRIIWANNLKGTEASAILSFDREYAEVEIPESVIDSYKKIEEELTIAKQNTDQNKITNLEKQRANLESDYLVLEAHINANHQMPVVVKRLIPAIKLSVMHQMIGKKDSQKPWTHAGAAFWVRIKSNTENTDFNDWCQAFAREKPDMNGPDTFWYKDGEDLKKAIGYLRLSVKSQDGTKLSVETRSQDGRHFSTRIKPEPSQAILEVNGQDKGRMILEKSPIIQTHKDNLTGLCNNSPISVPGYWEAEDGLIYAPMSIGDDRSASSGHFVWMPRKPGQRGHIFSNVGNITWCLNVTDSDDYYIWGRVKTPSRRENAFLVRIFQNNDPANVQWNANYLYLSTWHTGVHNQWTWVRLNTDTTGHVIPEALRLPQGKIFLQLYAAKAGAKIDRLFIANNPLDHPR